MSRIAFFTAPKTGISAEVVERKNGYAVIVIDTDAQATVGIRTYPKNLLPQAVAYAEACCDEGTWEKIFVPVFPDGNEIDKEVPAQEQIKTFVVGKTYWTRSSCDHECIFAWAVVKRTDKTVWIQDKRGIDIRARRISIIDGVETIMPSGTYSMAPVLRADRFEA